MTPSGNQTLTGNDRLTSYLWPLVAAALLLAIYSWVFRDFLGTQIERAWRLQADWGHTLVIPLVSLYFVYLNREKLRGIQFRTTWAGLALVIAGLGWYTFCLLNDAVRHHNLQAAGAWVTLCGLVLLFVGFRAMRYLWFPLIYLLIFGQSTSDRAITMVTFVLQDIAAAGSYFVLLFMGLDVELEGNTLFVFDTQGQGNPLNIAEACSGMRMLMAFLALGVAMAYTGLHRFWQQALLVTMGIPTALFVNILRVVTLALLGQWDVGLAAGDFHNFIGLLWLAPALFIYLGLMWIIRNVVVESGGKSVSAGAPVPSKRTGPSASPQPPTEESTSGKVTDLV